MLEFTENLGNRDDLQPTERLTLAYEQRGKCRQRLRLDRVILPFLGALTSRA